MLQNFGNSAKYSEDEKKMFNLLAAMQQVENLLKLSEEFEYTNYLQRSLYKLKYEFERQFKLLDKSVQSD